ncbi:MAG: ABC transporter ATP-binding protein [Bacillota bacterium]|nr:ABC transporter ATP-binding protein [Bacillota bacterium]
MIEINSLDFSYSKKGRKVLDGFSLNIAPGEILALLGPNGIGKSTAISLISGLRKAKSGTVVIDGVPINEMKPSERAKKIGYVAQAPEFPDLSVYDSILLGRLPNFTFSPCKYDKAATEEIIDSIGLRELASSNVNEISGGERQLAAIGRALVNDPPFLILDEPTSNLDMANQFRVLSLIKRLSKERNTAVLVSLHDLNEALLIADKFAFMQEGKIAFVADYESLNEKMISSTYGVDVTISSIEGKKHILIKENL